MTTTLLHPIATTRPCERRPANWWDLGDPGNAKAIKLCATCPAKNTCKPASRKPRSQIIAGIPYSDTGYALGICDTCEQPLTSGSHRGASGITRCDDCRNKTIAAHHNTITAMLANGYGARSIAAATGLTEHSVRHYCERHRLTEVKPGPNYRRDALVERWLQVYEDGQTFAQTAEILNVNPHRLKSAVARARKDGDPRIPRFTSPPRQVAA